MKDEDAAVTTEMTDGPQLFEPDRLLVADVTYLSCPPRQFEREVGAFLTVADVQAANSSGSVVFITAAERDELISDMVSSWRKKNARDHAELSKQHVLARALRMLRRPTNVAP